MLLMIRRSFAELSLSAFAAFYNALVRYAAHFAKLCWRRRLAGANPAVGDEARKGFPSTAIWERLRWLGVRYLPRYRLRGELIVVYKMFSGGLGLDPSLLFIPPWYRA